jgi:hypothetical protein
VESVDGNMESVDGNVESVDGNVESVDGKMKSVDGVSMVRCRATSEFGDKSCKSRVDDLTMLCKTRQDGEHLRVTGILHFANARSMLWCMATS